MVPSGAARLSIPADNRLILNANDTAGILKLTEIPVGTSNAGTYAKHCGSCHGLLMEGTDAGVALRGVIGRVGLGEAMAVIREGRGRMPSFEHMNEIEWRAVVAFLVSPEPQADEPSTEFGYIHGGYIYLRDHENLPGNSPPWGTLNSIDLATGEIRLEGAVRRLPHTTRDWVTGRSTTAARW